MSVRLFATSGPARAAKAKRRLLFLLVVILAIAIFAPTIVLRTPLRGLLLARLVPANVGTVTAQTLTAGWFTPISAKQVVFLDPSGNRLAEIERLSIDRTLTALLSNHRNLGTIRLENATVYALVRPDGSSIEDAILAASETPPGQEREADTSATGGPAYRLEVVNGRLLTRDAATGETWSAESLTATLHHPASGEQKIEVAGFLRPVQADGVTLAPSPEGAGRFELRWGTTDEGIHATRLVLGSVPLAPFRPWLQRFDPALQLTGQLTGKLSLSHPPGGHESLTGSSNGRLSLTSLKVRATALHGETLQLDQTNLAWQGTARGGRLAVENLSLESDIALFDLRGTAPARVVKQLAAGEWAPLEAMTRSDLDIEGRVHLARLANRLPGLLLIREGTKITDGQVRFASKSEPSEKGRKLTASLSTTSLSGTTGGRPISWDAPLRVDLVARQRDNHFRLDRLDCKSDFLHFTGSGDTRQIKIEGQVDLDQLVRRLESFVDLTDWQLTGRSKLEITGQTDDRGRLVARGSGSFSDMVVAFRGDTLAHERQLDWQTHLEGKSDASSLWPRQLQSGQLSLTAGGDQMTLRLTEPTLLEESFSATEWPVAITTTGQLGSWATRLRPWVDLSAWQLAGRLDLRAEGRVRAEPLALTLASSDLKIGSLEAISEGWEIREPRIEWQGDASWDATTGTLTSRGGQLLSSTAAASLRDWFWTSDPRQARRVGGLAAVRADLGRLAAMRRATSENDPDALTPVGEVSGNVQLAAEGDQILARLDLTGTHIALKKPQPSLPGQPATWQTVWQEPQLRVTGTVAYSPALDRLKLESLRTESASLALAASGQIENLTSEGEVDLAGTVDYNLSRLTPLIAQYVGQGIALAGNGPARFEVRGSLASQLQLETTPRRLGTTAAQASGGTRGTAKTWQARVLAPWTSASLYGLQVGDGRLSAELANGRIAIEPLDFAIGGGRFTASPSVRLDPAPGEVTLAAGPLLTDLRITKEVSEQMLKYIAPVLANHARGEGLFSMTLTGARIPLGDPAAAEVAGQLLVQSATITPGPMVKEWIQVARQIEALARGGTPSASPTGRPTTEMTIRSRNVSFQLTGGRVYHQGLEFEIEGVVFRSRGSVGFDQTLSLMIEIPIQDRWIEGNRLLSGLRGKSIELPVTGTFTNRRVDAKAALKQATQLFLGRDAIRGAIGNEVNRALNKWLGGE